MTHPHEWVEEEWLEDPEGYRDKVEREKQEASYNTLSEQLQNAVNSGDFTRAGEIGDSLLRLPHVIPAEMDRNDCYLISMAYSSTGRHDESIKLVENWKSLEENKIMMPWFITILIHGSYLERAIETWKRHKTLLTHEKFDPFVIANLLAAYDRLGRQEEAISELEDYFTKQGAGGDNGLMKFNAACLYSLCGRMNQSLEMAALSLEEGKDRESFYGDPGLENFRKEPAFDLLMSETPIVAVTFTGNGRVNTWNWSSTSRDGK
jgi:tetratricopeptide (TPR) repeat protein